MYVLPFITLWWQALQAELAGGPEASASFVAVPIWISAKTKD